jgi:hypothetical protein
MFSPNHLSGYKLYMSAQESSTPKIYVKCPSDPTAIDFHLDIKASALACTPRSQLLHEHENEDIILTYSVGISSDVVSMDPSYLCHRAYSKYSLENEVHFVVFDSSIVQSTVFMSLKMKSVRCFASRSVRCVISKDVAPLNVIGPIF